MNKKRDLKIYTKMIAALLALTLLGITLQTSQVVAFPLSQKISANTPPTISDIPDQVTDEDQAIGPILFTVSDLETPADDLIVTGASSNLAVVSLSGIFLGGFDETRWVEITPVSHATGTTIITLTVDDGEDTAFDQFQVTVGSENDPPTISRIPNQRTPMDTVLGPIAFTIADVETPVNDLILEAVSSNQGIIANTGILLGGTGENRTITLTPQPGVAGVTKIILSVSDGERISYEDFDVMVFLMEIFFPSAYGNPLVIPPVIELYFPLTLSGE